MVSASRFVVRMASPPRWHDVGVDQRQHLARFFLRHSTAVGKVKSKTVRADERALLANVVTQNAAQTRVQQVGGGVIAPGGFAPARSMVATAT